MNELIPQNLRFLAQKCAFPLYLVGGSVRDFLAGFPLRGAAFALAPPAPDEAFARAAEVRLLAYGAARVGIQTAMVQVLYLLYNAILRPRLSRYGAR